MTQDCKKKLMTSIYDRSTENQPSSSVKYSLGGIAIIHLVYRLEHSYLAFNIYTTIEK